MSRVSHNEATSPSSYGTMESYQVTMISAFSPISLYTNLLTKNLSSGGRGHPYRLDDWGWKRSHRVRRIQPVYVCIYDTHKSSAGVSFLLARHFPVLIVRAACPHYDLIHCYRSVGLSRFVCAGRSGFRITHSGNGSWPCHSVL